MLTQMLFLAAIWLELSLITLFLRGTKPQKGGWYRSVPWFITIVLAGVLWALFSFAQGRNILGFTAFSILFGLYWIFRLRDWHGLAHAFWIFSLLTAALYIIYSIGVAAFTPLHPLTFIAALFLSIIEAIALILALSFAFESLDVLCRVHWHRRAEPRKPIEGFTPIVSLHLPTYNESIEIVERTLRSLAMLDYPYFEVLVVDISTSGEANWQALAKLCSELGPGFRFFHLDNWPGYKLGALNFALTQTHPQAKILGVVDADYHVSSEFLKELVPYFAEPNLAFVQTPRNYQDYHGNPYLEYAYKYFYSVSMPSRNEANAIVFAGPTGLIRRRALQEIGGWDEWSMTEDAEASLRILKLGYESVYVNKAYGTGLQPFSFEGLKRQRFRWAFGAMQILKKHWASLMPWSHWTEPKNHLTPAQRYFYLIGSLQWLNEPLILAFTAFLILGSILAFLPQNNTVHPFTVPLIVMPVFFLLLGSWRLLWILRSTVGFNIRGLLQAIARTYVLAWTVTLACIQGLLQPTSPATGSAKAQSRSGLGRVLRWETAVGLLSALLAILVNFVISQPVSFVLAGILSLLSLFFLSASFRGTASAKAPQQPNVLRKELETGARSAQQKRVSRVLLGVLLGLLAGIGASAFMPAPTETPDYARFQPAEIRMQSWGVFPGSADAAAEETAEAVPTDMLTATLTPTGTPRQTIPAMPSATVTSSLTPGRTPLATFVFQTATPTMVSDGYIAPAVSSITPSPVSALPSATATPIAATGSSLAATASPVPATASPIPATASPVPATATRIPPTPILPTATRVPATATRIPATSVPPTVPPILTTVAPILTTVAPIISTTVPILTTVAPIINTTAPIVTTAAPVLTTVAPILTTVAPNPPTPTPRDTREPRNTHEPRDTREPRDDEPRDTREPRPTREHR
jgi:cellulose synthase/poly-beta-1,6-N-acetylglucosamine synthase-like glycosyltransferase